MSIKLLRRLIVDILNESGTKEGITVYHASPQASLTRIMPRFSRKFGEKGIFVSESMESMWNSWISWALQRPGKEGGSRGEGYFDTVTVYTARIPRDVFDEAKKAHGSAASTAIQDDGAGALGAFAWDIETFIPESLMPFIEPTSKKVYTRREIEKQMAGNPRWKKAGFNPFKGAEDISYIGTKRNPAKAEYKRLKDAALAGALKRGGRVGDFKQDPKGFASAYGVTYQQDLIEYLEELSTLAKKTELSDEDSERLGVLVPELERIIAMKEPFGPAMDIPSQKIRTGAGETRKDVRRRGKGWQRQQ
jgi:hypothetical protein